MFNVCVLYYFVKYLNARNNELLESYKVTYDCVAFQSGLFIVLGFVSYMTVTS